MKTIAKITVILLVFGLFGCDLTKRVPEDKLLLNNNRIIVKNEYPKYPVPTWELDDIIKQDENRHVMTVPNSDAFRNPDKPLLRYKLWLYNMPNPERMERARERKIARRRNRLEKKNRKRLAKGKDTIDIEEELDTTIFRDAIRETAGEPPVILDTAKAKISAEQMQIWMVKNGWFNALVRDSIVYDSAHQLATVNYIVHPNRPYTIRKIKYDVDDKRLLSYARFVLTSDSIIETGKKFRVQDLNHLRKKITHWCRNQGHYSFGKDYVYYKVDSTVGNHQVDITIKIKRPKVPHPKIKDSLIDGRHHAYYYRDVIFFINYHGDDLSTYDTLHHQGFIIAYNGEKPEIRPRALVRGMLIRTGELYEEDSVSITYKRLNNLGIFKSITIRFKDPTRVGRGYEMDCYIQLELKKYQGIRFQTNATNEAGNLGVSGRSSYYHRNILRGAEKLETGIAGGLEVQQLLVTDAEVNQQPQTNTFLSRNSPFNTIEYGPELGIKFPRLLFFPRMAINSDYLSTEFKVGLNRQIRPDFNRTVQNISWIYQLVPAPHLSWKFSAWELSALKINKSPAFQNRLDSLNDPVLNTSYQDHIISNAKVSFTYSEFNSMFKSHRNKVYFNTVLEISGMIPRLYSKSIAPTVSDWFQTDLIPEYDPTTDSYDFFGIRFAQYSKMQFDLRDYLKLSDGVTQVFRLMAGVGVPGANLQQALPFEKAFFSGGPNGLRAWKARSLGPGSYLDSSFSGTYDKIGDIKIEGNIETRISFDMFELALFLDAGNIWLMKPSKRVGAEFSSDFYKQIAVGGGAGLRIDLDFFIIRFDFAKQLRDPTLGPNERWIWDKKNDINDLRDDVLGENADDYKMKWNINLGIGYPF